MTHVVECETFAKWLKTLRDQLGRRNIIRRIARIVSTDNFGDHASVGDGVSELRIHTGPGYRIYYTILMRRSCFSFAAETRVRRIATSRRRRRWPCILNGAGFDRWMKGKRP